MNTSDAPHLPVLLVWHRHHGEGLVTRPLRWWDRLEARVLAPSLDRRLAAGLAPESDRRLAARAVVLVSPDHRLALARNWEHLLDTAGGSGPAPGRVPLCRERITAAEPALRAMLAALRAPLPVPAGGVARARLLLSDGAGPLYNRTCPTDLVAVVGQVTGELDSSADLMAST
jgi:hypothetical protein